MNPSTVSFTLALNADPLTVAGVVDSIHKFFGISTNAGVDPASLPKSGSTDDNAGDDGAANANAPATDKNGLPWDARIHSSSKALNADGTWRYRKGVDAATKTKVEGELRATLNASGVPTAAVATPAATPTLPTPPTTAVTMPPIPGANMETPFTRLVKFLAENTWSETNTNGKVTTDWVKQVLVNYQVPNGDLQNLAHNLELCTTIENAIRGALQLPLV